MSSSAFGQPPTPGEACGHHCPNHPDWIPCQRPAGHSRELGHRDSAGSDVQHVWQDHARS